MTIARDELQLARDLLNHNIRHMRDALARSPGPRHAPLLRQALKNALYGDRQATGRLDIVATRLDRPGPTQAMPPCNLSTPHEP